MQWVKARLGARQLQFSYVWKSLLLHSSKLGSGADGAGGGAGAGGGEVSSTASDGNQQKEQKVRICVLGEKKTRVKLKIIGFFL